MINARYVRSIIEVAEQNYDAQLDELLTAFMPRFVATGGKSVAVTEQDCAAFNIEFEAAKKMLIKRGFHVRKSNQFGLDTGTEIFVSLPPGAE